MKSSFLPFFITPFIAFSCFQANANVPFDGEVYGRLNVTREEVKNRLTHENEMETNTYFSHVGLNVNHDLNDTFTAFGKLEYVLLKDNESEHFEFDRFETALVFVGIESKYGTVTYGDNEPPMKLSQYRVDVFNDHQGDIKYFIPGETLSSKLLTYKTPKFFDVVTFIGGTVLGDKGDKKPFKSTSSAVHIDLGRAYFAMGYEKDVQSGNLIQQKLDTLRLSSQYNFDHVQLGALYQKSQNGKSFKTDYSAESWLVSWLWNINSFDIKSQFGRTKEEIDHVSSERQQWTFGVDYSFTEYLKLVSYYSSLSNKTTSLYLSDERRLGAGLEFNF